MNRLELKIQTDPYLFVKSGTDVYYINFVDDDGKRRRVSTKTNNKIKATRIFNNWLREYKASKLEIDSDDKKTLEEFTEEFLLSRIPPRMAESTYLLYKEALLKASKAWGPDFDVSEITDRSLDKYIAYLLRQDIKIPTVNKNYRHLKCAIRQAVKWGYMQPILDWPKELKEKKIARFMTKEQLQVYFETAKKINHEWFDFCLLSCYTGLRSGEILRLTPQDIDNPKGFLRITPEQKNKDESRIPINDIARDIFNKYKKRKEKIFSFSSVYFVSYKFKKILKQAGLPTDFRFHDLRHTYASHMAMAGEDILTIKELMRHKSISSTLVYTKLSPAHLKEASNRINYGIKIDEDKE